jgi:RimJ/RimL family protein N-acetyltransferase/catechol 2,3-dioxygenase-like lactoylglutathione lyase family enzyme
VVVTQPGFTTERLWLRAMAASDGDAIHAVRGDAEAMRWWYAGVSPSIEVTREEIADMATWGTQWVFGRHGDDTVLGYVGFHGLGADEGCGFGYLLLRDAWGDGLVVEAARALLDFGFRDVGIRHAELWIDPANRRSQRVADKLGARFRGWARTDRRSVIHGVTRDEWLGGLGSPIAMSVVPAIDVSDLDRAAALWCDGLGFRLSFATDMVAHVLADWTGGPGVRMRRGTRFGGRILVDVASVVDEVTARAVTAGWQLQSPPTDHPWGARESELADPDGNLVVLAGQP